MRIFLLAAAAAIAAPALAQLPPQGLAQPSPSQDFEFRQQQEQVRQQLIQQQNQLMALEAQMKAQQGIADIQAQKQSPRLTPPDVSGRGPLPNIDTSKLASIPDSVLADSNRKVLDAAANQH